MTNSVMLVIYERDTSRSLGIEFKCFAKNVCDTKYYKHC